MSIQERIEAFYLLHDDVSYGSVEAFADDIERIARAEERERIAREIEAHAEKVGAVDPPPQQDDYYAAMHDAARIARGSRAQA